ncbi:glycosyltransferase family 4 protein [Patescibacteria group bacterium]
MNIAIAGRSMNTPGGVKEYLEGLCYGLSQTELPADVKIFFLMTPKGATPKYANAVTVVRRGPENRFIWDYITLPALLARLQIDVILHVKNTIPFTVKTPGAVVVHDLLHLLQPDVYKKKDSIYMNWAMRRSLPKAKKIIAISQNTKKDLLQEIPELNEVKISVVYQDAMPQFDATVSTETIEVVRQEFNLPERFLLFTGSLSPRKNLLGLFEAFAKIQNDVPHHLVITGGKAWKEGPIHSRLQELQLEQRVHILGFVPDKNMPALYQAAEAYIYPSFYEGFGIPLLEAFAAGTPVISSNTSSLPEVGGEAALYINPKDPSDIAKKIKTLLSSSELREKLQEKGYEQRKKFSWVESSKEILQLLLSIGKI